MRFAASQHQAKAAPFIRALVDAGHEFVEGGGPADLYLIDLDSPWNRPLYEPHLERGAKVFCYPHGPTTACLYEIPRYAPDYRVTARFVFAEGQQELMRVVGLDAPTHAVGFPWCEQRPFRPCASPRRVLFGPTHPLERTGSLGERYINRNRDIFEQLLAMDGIELTVRHLMDMELGGLWPVDGVTYVRGQADNSTAEIDAADVVIADGTFASLAIARGAPTIMTDRIGTPVVNDPDGMQMSPPGWDSYKHMFDFPYDVADGPLADLIPVVAAAEGPVGEWRKRWIGKQFDPAAFVRMIEDLTREPVVESELRERVVVAFADEVIESPELLRTYARLVDGDDRTTLMLYAPDGDAEQLVDPLTGAIAAAGLDDASTPDMLLNALPRYEVHETALARRAAAILTQRDVEGPLGGLANLLGDSGRAVPALR